MPPARQQSLQASIAQRQAQENTVRSQISPMEQSLAISKERVADLEKLLGGQYVSRHEFLARKQEMVDHRRATAERPENGTRGRMCEIESPEAAKIEVVGQAQDKDDDAVWICPALPP